MKKTVLEVKDLDISFVQYKQGLKKQTIKVIDQLSVDLKEGEILAIVGSSGSGKSLLTNAIFGILPDNALCNGQFYYQGEALTPEITAGIRGKEIALIPQSVNYLDPLMTVENQIKISVQDKKNADAVVDKLFEKYGLDKKVKKYYPFQLSGGMARKVLLATALASNAKVIIADEPTPGLDEPALKEVLKDFRILVEQGCSVLMITHDIQAALTIADRVAIFYAGTTLEIANSSDFSGEGEALRHPYTKALNDARPSRLFQPIDGIQPFQKEEKEQCVFYERCPMKTEYCKTNNPEYRDVRGGKVRCHYAT